MMSRVPGGKLLLVDDTVEQLILLTDVLTAAGYSCESVTSGAKALKKLAEQEFILVILDIKMPGLDGLETARLIRGSAEGESLPIIFLTAQALAAEDIFAGYEVGAIDYLIKPIDSRILFSKINIFAKLSQHSYLLQERVNECEWVRDQLHHLTHNLQLIVAERTEAINIKNKQLEEQLQSQQRLEEILTAISDAVFMTDALGNLTFVSPNVETIFAYNPKEVWGMKTIEKLLGQLAIDWQVLAEMEEIVNFEHTIFDKRGQAHSLLINIKKVAIADSCYLYSCRDISERKKMENALRQSQAQLDNILSHTLNALIVLNEQGLIQYVNTRATQLFGRSQAALLNSDWGYPLTTENTEIEILTPEGLLHNAELSLVKIIWQEQPAYLISLKEITEQKAMAQSLQKNEQKYQHLLENIQSGVVVHAPDTSITYANPTALKFLGLLATEIQNRQAQDPVWRFYFGDGSPMAVEDFPVNQVLHSLQAVQNFEVGVYRQDLEDIYWAWVNAYPELNEEGILQQIIVTFIDITERKEAEFKLKNLNESLEYLVEERTRELGAVNIQLLQEIIEKEQVELALQSQEIKYRSLMRDAGEAIILMDIDKNILEVNRQAINLTGYSENDWLNITNLNFIPSHRQTELLNHWHSLLSQGSFLWSNAEIITQTGESICTDITASLIEYENQQVIQLIVRDMRERHRAEADIKRALEKERELNQLKSQFVDIVSHEFRTPLTSILGFSELLLRYQNRLTSEKQIHYIGNIQNSGLRLKELIEDVLCLSRAESGRLPLEQTSTILAEFCQELLEEIRYGIGNNHDLQWQESYPCYQPILIDTRLIRHILWNLLGNAIKYSPSGSVVLLILTWEPQNFLLEIRDQGIGIPAQDQERLFESFQRASNVGNIEGTGLGLSIVKRYVELQEGDFFFDSQVNEGSSFFVRLPLYWAEVDPAIPI